jgi:endonuclease/exonuclease/phosphatase family metal-dependent hydrolase
MNFLKLFLSACMICFFSIVQAQQLTIETFNLRFDNPKDTGNLWVNRSPVVAALIRFHKFDILGTQEGLFNQLEDINRQLPEYEHYGLGRDDGKEKGEHSAIFFKKDRFNLLKKGDFWLSETPDKPSKGWDAKLNSICSWVQLLDKISGKKFYFFNVHYDHQGKIAREESSKLILQRIKAIAGNAHAILTGDLNGDMSSSWYAGLANSRFLKDTFKEAAHPYINNPSTNGFGRSITGNTVIDHLFATNDFLVTRWGILTDTYHGKYPSDHFPVLADIEFK